MSAFGKLVTGGLLGAGAIAGWKYFQNLKRAGANLVVVPKAMIHQLSWTGLIIRVDLLMKNPTKGSCSIKFPFVKLLYKDTLIGSSKAVNREIKIPAFGEVLIDKILVEIPMLSVFSVVFALIKALYAKEAVTLVTQSITTIDLGPISVPFDNKLPRPKIS
ncbi:hypothetical protein [Flaviaesturariibacter aridisoli]|uniref:Uncharacterized protein n=1 Tax=Flaviaesturariibacter aridisoli TaxID=2545761 RepID=A0A4R4E3B7_9BACT|nr:hypothetical protein [Flaviaesturariibacter aridisoli]TCZ74054.1 hypothetical protein E0486_02980 [Flaviaesturariibacter aridisoli]